MDPIGPRAGVWKEELTHEDICAVTTIQSYLAIVDLSTTCLLLGSLTCWFILCVKVIISEKVEKKDIDNSAGQDKRHLLTGSVIKMDMMGQRNSSGAPESNSSSSLRSEMCKNLAFLITIYEKHLTLVSSSPVLTWSSAHECGQMTNRSSQVSTTNLMIFVENYFHPIGK